MGLLPQACRVWLSHDGTSPRERQEEAVKPGVVQAEITDKFQSGVKDPQHCPEGLPKETSQIPSSGESAQRIVTPSPKLALRSTHCPMKLYQSGIWFNFWKAIF